MMPPWKYIDWQVRDKLYQLRGWPRWLSWLRTLVSRAPPRPDDDIKSLRAKRRAHRRGKLLGELVDEAIRIDRENDPTYTPEYVSGDGSRPQHNKMPGRMKTEKALGGPTRADNWLRDH